MNVNPAFWVTCYTTAWVLRRSFCSWYFLIVLIFLVGYRKIRSICPHSVRSYPCLMALLYHQRDKRTPSILLFQVSRLFPHMLLNGPSYPSSLSSTFASLCIWLLASMSKFSGVLLITLNSKLMAVTLQQLIFRNLWEKTKINLRTRRVQGPFTWYFDVKFMGNLIVEKIKELVRHDCAYCNQLTAKHFSLNLYKHRE